LARGRFDIRPAVFIDPREARFDFSRMAGIAVAPVLCPATLRLSA
jgi:hypothetical protein